MTQAHKTPGAIVEFKEKVFKPPYTPYYDRYQGLTFEVISDLPGGHVMIRNDAIGEIAIHDDEIKTVRRKKSKIL